MDGHGNGWEPALLQEHEIAVQIDTRFSSQQIVSSLKNILATIQPKTKIHDKKYKYYLAVWDLSQQDKTQKEIAEIVWPDEYKANAKAVSDYTTGEKGYLIQRVSDHEKAAQS